MSLKRTFDTRWEGNGRVCAACIIAGGSPVAWLWAADSTHDNLSRVTVTTLNNPWFALGLLACWGILGYH